MDTIRTSADIYGPKHRNSLLLVVRGEGQSRGWSISAGSVCYSCAASVHMLLHIPRLLLGSLPASWLESITLGDTVSWGVGTTGTIHITQLITRCIKRVSFLYSRRSYSVFISSFGILCSLYDTLPFFSHTFIWNFTFVSKIYLKVQSLVYSNCLWSTLGH